MAKYDQQLAALAQAPVAAQGKLSYQWLVKSVSGHNVLRNQMRNIIKNLPEPLRPWHQQLNANINRVVFIAALPFINQQFAPLAKWYQQHLAACYPSLIKSRHDCAYSDWVKFYAPGGRFVKFSQQWLTTLVHAPELHDLWLGPGHFYWQWVRRAQHAQRQYAWDRKGASLTLWPKSLGHDIALVTLVWGYQRWHLDHGPIRPFHLSLTGDSHKHGSITVQAFGQPPFTERLNSPWDWFRVFSGLSPVVGGYHCKIRVVRG